MDEKEKRSYEISFLSKDEKSGGELAGFLKEKGAEMVFENPPNRINLAYKIEKEDSAHFGYFHFSLEPEKIKELEQELKRVPFLLRFLIVTPPLLRDRARPAPRSPLRFVPEKIARKAAAPAPLSNKELEKEIKEISQ